MGGPGSDPSPGTPMYICRANVQGSVVPGKWVQGNCNVAFGGSERIMRSYEVAYGSARWGAYQGNSYGLAQTGNADGSPLFSCRVQYVDASGNGYGYQPGKLVSDGTCHIPFGGGEVVQNPPFEVLYATGGGRPPYQPPYYPPYPFPYPQPQPQAQPYPACQLGGPGVTLDTRRGWWVGPNCSSIDSPGHIVELKYPSDQPPPPAYVPGPSSVAWRPAQKPFTPGDDAIKGGPGNGPKPGAPLYVCRVTFNGGSYPALYPGKWVEGVCHFSDNAGKEQTANTYEVAYGPAEWRDFDGDVSALVPGGYDSDGTHLYICRKKLSFFGDKGLQPGRLENGVCHIPYGNDSAENPPFQALYNVFLPAGPATPHDQPVAPAGPTQPHGLLVSLASGTSATAGTVTVTNGSTNTTITKPLPPNSTLRQCMDILQQAAFQAGLQIQSQPDGLRVYGVNNAVSITQASASVTQF